VKRDSFSDLQVRLVFGDQSYSQFELLCPSSFFSVPLNTTFPRIDIKGGPPGLPSPVSNKKVEQSDRWFFPAVFFPISILAQRGQNTDDSDEIDEY